MNSYLKHIEHTELITEIDATLTTGDLDYPGTAIEVRSADAEDRELFHVVVDGKGRQQVLFYAHDANYRIPLDRLSDIISKAKTEVHMTE